MTKTEAPPAVEPRVPAIYPALKAVKRAIHERGIAKAGFNKSGNYKYRGIDDVMDAFSATLAENAVMTVPRLEEVPTLGDIRTNSGSNNRCSVMMRVDLVSLEDGSFITLGPLSGEAADSFDKATTKAQSVAYRTIMLLGFTAGLGPAADPEYDYDRERAEAIAGGKKAKSDKKPAPPKQEPQADQRRGIELTENQKKWLLNQAGIAGYESLEELNRDFAWIDKDNCKAIAAEITADGFVPGRGR